MKNLPTRLENGATVIHCTAIHEGGNGWRPTAIALCRYEHQIGKYVTWEIYRDESGKWHAQSGHYLKTWVEAVEDYQARVPSRFASQRNGD